jgi:hypothetical protein
MTVEPPATVKDDHVMPTTRGVAIAIIPVLTAAFVILYLFPTRTKQLWAWTINPTMTAMLMGGGYLAGAYLFVRVATTKQWHRVDPLFPAITLFTTLLLLATIIHWDRFNHGHVSFWAWLFLYIVTPPLLPWLWVRNRRFDPRVPEPGERLVPSPIRTLMVVAGAGQLAFCALLFVRPTAVMGHWPWMLTPLTARVLAAFAAFPAVGYLSFAFDRRWSSFRHVLEVATLGIVFIGIAAIRAADEFNGPRGIVVAWRIGLVVALVLLIALQLAMNRPARGA